MLNDDYYAYLKDSDGNTYDLPYTFNVPLKSTTFTIKYKLPYEYVEFIQKQIYLGSYPQTKVIDSSTINQLDNLKCELPTSTNHYQWTDYRYYIKSKVTSYMYYQDITLDNNKYRAVYFRSYRPYYTTKSSSKIDSSHDDNGYYTSQNNTYDKIFLLSYQEINKYYYQNNEGQAQCIDYANSQGLFVSLDSLCNSNWWSCTLYDNYYDSVFSVSLIGFIESLVNYYCNGVRSVCWINL